MKATKDSMLDQEQKSLRRAKIILGAVTVLLFAITYLGLFDTYFYGWHLRADKWAKIAGAVSFAFCGISIIAGNWISNKFSDETMWYVIWIILLAFSLFVSFGFNMGLPV